MDSINATDIEQLEKFILDPTTTVKKKNKKKKKKNTTESDSNNQNTNNSNTKEVKKEPKKEPKKDVKKKPKKGGMMALLAKKLKLQQEQEEAERLELERLEKEEEERIRLEIELEEKEKKRREEQAEQAKLLKQENAKKNKDKQKEISRINALKKLGCNINNLPSRRKQSYNETKNNKLQETTSKTNIEQPMTTSETNNNKSTDNRSDNIVLGDWEDELGDWEDEIDQIENNTLIFKAEQDEIETDNQTINTNTELNKEEINEEINEEVEEVKLKAPICCILGNVDVGKTTFVDCIGSTKVQQNEAGGITQTINTIFVKLKSNPFNIPGVILIDTPGHDSFYNLRSFGASLCNFVILMVDIMEGVKEQTLKSIELIRENKIPYVVVLNKLDRINMWKTDLKTPLKKSLNNQPINAINHFETLVSNVITQFSENGLNAELHFRNQNPKKFASIFPVSSHTKEGISELFSGMIKLITVYLKKDIILNETFKGLVVDNGIQKGLGKCVDVLLYDGTINRNDSVMLTSINGPYTVSISKLGLLEDNKFELKEEISATRQIKVIIKDKTHFEPLIGGPVYLLPSTLSKKEYTEKITQYAQLIDEYLDDKEDELQKNISNTGVLVYASSYGGLTAITEYLEKEDIPYIDAKVGNVKLPAVQRLLNVNTTPETKIYNMIICFNTELDKRASQEVEKSNIVLINDEIIYRIFEKVQETIEKNKNNNKNDFEDSISYPAIVKILPKCVFAHKNPIIVGVKVLNGMLRKGSCLKTLKKIKNNETNTNEIIFLGVVSNMKNPKGENITEAKIGDELTIEIMNNNPGESHKNIGRDFEHEAELWTKMDEESYYIMKTHFYETMSNDEKSAFHELAKIYKLEY